MQPRVSEQNFIVSFEKNLEAFSSIAIFFNFLRQLPISQVATILKEILQNPGNKIIQLAQSHGNNKSLVRLILCYMVAKEAPATEKERLFGEYVDTQLIISAYYQPGIAFPLDIGQKHARVKSISIFMFTDFPDPKYAIERLAICKFILVPRILGIESPLLRLLALNIVTDPMTPVGSGMMGKNPAKARLPSETRGDTGKLCKENKRLEEIELARFFGPTYESEETCFNAMHSIFISFFSSHPKNSVSITTKFLNMFRSTTVTVEAKKVVELPRR